MQPQRVALLGGTFDPPHVGHLVVANAASEQLDVSSVEMIVAGDPYQKTETRDITSPMVRRELLAAALTENANQRVRLNETELNRAGPSYTIDTIKTLQHCHPNTEFVLIVGNDAASSMHTWHCANEVMNSVEIVVAQRGGYTTADAEIAANVTKLNAPVLDVSSTDVRFRVRNGHSTTWLIPRAVAQLIDEHHLYTEPGPQAL